METYTLRIKLKSDATFGRGDSVPGLVDAEIEQDIYGLPYLRGKTLKGLLVEECANILYALHKQAAAEPPAINEKDFYASADRLFGQPGSRDKIDTHLRVGDACLPEALRQVIRAQVDAKKLQPAEVLEMLTDIRHQTAVDETGQPEDGSLRASRVLLRDTVFEAQLTLDDSLENRERGLLAACVKALRRAGINRNRGLGRISAELWQNGEPKTDTLFAHFEHEVKSQ